MRQNVKEVEIKGRKFRIRKFDPLTGLSILRDLLTCATPINIASLLPGLSDSQFLRGAQAKTMTRKEFEELQKDILRYASEPLPAGDTPVIDDAGNFAVIDCDLTITVNLIKEILLFNYKDFFTENLSSLGLLEKVPDSTSSTAPTSAK